MRLATVEWTLTTAVLRREDGGEDVLRSDQPAEISTGPVSIHCSLVPHPAMHGLPCLARATSSWRWPFSE